jgi:glycosyltransferase involved in cell wall biosynthesis
MSGKLMTQAPTVSVILPTYERPEFLQQAVASVQAQSWTDWELIISDDGSGSDTASLLDRFNREPRVRVIRSSHQGNPGAVRNRALCEARGEYVAFIDSDDLWLPPKLEEQLARLRASRDCQWSYTEFIRINQDGVSIDYERNPHRILHEGWIFKQLLELRVGIALPTVMVKRDLLETVGGFDERQALHEDTDLWLRLALLSPVRVLKQPLTCVRRHSSHFPSTGVSSLEARRRVLEKMGQLVTESQHRDLVRTERARAAAALAVLYAASGKRAPTLRTLASSLRYSWRCGGWYVSACRALAHLVLPSWSVKVVRYWRRERRGSCI